MVGANKVGANKVGANIGLARETSSPWIYPEEVRVVRTVANCIPPIVAG